jgi:Ca-activated chloride channel homolog
MIQYILEQFAGVFLWLVRLIWPEADEFLNPGYLFLMLMIPGYLVYFYGWYDYRRLVVPLSYDPQKIAPKKLNLSFLRFLPQILNILAFFLMVVAMARPISSNTTDLKYSEGIDIMLVLDTSGSMETDDFIPNRLAVAKETAVKFLEGREFDRIGVVVFAEDAFSFAPLTLDYDLLKKQINSISSGIMPKEGTAMGSAISVGINRMKESKTPSKVMILLTDGASNRGQIDPVTAAELARRANIKIYAIGIGKQEFQRRTAFGIQTVKSDLDEPTLQKVADVTGGKFFRSTDARSLETIFENISKMEKVEIQEQLFKEETDLYPGILVVAFILFSASLLLMVTFVHNPLEG